MENSGEEIKEITAENNENINDIRKKIKESLKEKENCNFIEPKSSRKEKNTDQKGRYSKNSIIEKYPGLKRYRSREKELLAREIAEVLEDDHSLEHSEL